MPDVKAVAIAIIPARYASTRIPGKALADIAGQPMIERVYRRAALAHEPAKVLVATDDRRIAQALEGVAEVVMTREDHQSGTDRVAEAAGALDAEIIVNVQGDLPLLDPSLVDGLIRVLRENPDLEMATAAVPVRSIEEFRDPSVVKVVRGADGRALYFSRAPIPANRDHPEDFAGALHHVGIYAYRRDTLLRLSALAPTELERSEKLEQLRALENGIAIGVIAASETPLEVDTDEDLRRARSAVARLDGQDHAS